MRNEDKTRKQLLDELAQVRQGMADLEALLLDSRVTAADTERQRAEGDQRRLERMEALREIDKAIISGLDLSEVLDIILAKLESVVPYHSAAIFLLDRDTAMVAAARGFPDMERVLQISFPVEDDALMNELMREKQPLVLADARADGRFLARGGTAYVRSWLGLPLIAKGEELGFLTVDHTEPGIYDEESAEQVQTFASQAAIAIENARLYQEAERELAERKRAEEELQRSYVKLDRAFQATVGVLVSAVELRDPYTAGHQRRVARLADAIAREMGLPEEQIEGTRVAAVIHDIGKINVPTEILSKPGRLSDNEFDLVKTHPQVGHDILNIPAKRDRGRGGLSQIEFGLIKTHPQAGYEVLKTIEFPWPVAEIVLQHHERLDGSGYPQGLCGEEIMLEARILAVADVVEAMSSHRPYRSARGQDKALEEISKNRGRLYDADVVDACLELFAQQRFDLD
jgi:HD-GYP domain-containing protein (c-di-GMP phosphodiesterase class II)